MSYVRSKMRFTRPVATHDRMADRESISAVRYDRYPTTKMKPGSMIWMFLVHLVRRESRKPNTMPRREPPKATTKKETGDRKKAHLQ